MVVLPHAGLLEVNKQALFNSLLLNGMEPSIGYVEPVLDGTLWRSISAKSVCHSSARRLVACVRVCASP